MSIARELVLVHLSATALLLLLFVVLVLCQRLARVLERTPAVPAHPSDTVAGSTVPEQVAVRPEAPAAGASVLDWTIDLRTPREPAAQLQTS